MVAGIYTARALESASSPRSATWLVFAALTLVHVYANYRAIAALQLRSLNAQRLETLVEDYIERAAAANGCEDNERRETHSCIFRGCCH